VLEITGDDVKGLNDEDLRAVVALLCEAELRRRNLPASAVTWGGNQTAKDGGVDVRVALPAATAIDGFVPRPSTGLQVKKQDMPKGEILKEMRPGGELRPSILSLADEGGAYIIVSSEGSVADSALALRIEAMAAAIKDLPNADKLSLDFYDRTRIATWLRDHPGLIPWVRDRIGKSLQGWQSHGAWAFAPDGVAGEYLLDDQLRIKTGRKDDGNGFSAVDGLDRIREVLRAPGSVARIVGLSGVGKTRFAQALFDERVGEQSLVPSLAIYTNMSDAPEPPPLALATNLVASRTRAIVIVDNCPPQLHQRLSEVARSLGSAISILTLEYDIRDDEPEGTEVFALEPSSEELLRKVIKKRFPHLSGIDVQTIAEFSGGNARIAITLAATAEKKDSLAGMSNEDLFGRLFHQRHEVDASLLAAAEACALVYSFDGETLDGSAAELPRLSNLIGKSASDVYAQVVELKSRNLVQQRSAWRAVLPQAIANRLAAKSLQKIPAPTIQDELVIKAPPRLRQSFSRRLGNLDGSKEAIAIAEKWLSPAGLLADVANLDEQGRAMLRNVAPLAPMRVLTAIETAISAGDEAAEKCGKHVRLIRSIAYDPNLFERAARLLIKLSQSPADSDGKASEAFASLFYLYLSGTHATIEQRLALVEELVKSGSAQERDLGVTALRSILEASYFSSNYAFEFGAQSRDYGYWPSTHADMAHWFKSALALIERVLNANLDCVPQVATALADKFKGLWCRAGRYDELEELSRMIAKSSFWREGWIQVHRTLRQEGKNLPVDVGKRLEELEKFLRPKDLVQKVNAIVLSRQVRGLYVEDLDVDDETQDGLNPYTRAEKAAEKLGEELAEDSASFEALRPELVTGRGRLVRLGQGLARGTDGEATWNALVAQLSATPAGTRNVQVLIGMLSGFNVDDAMLANRLLDEAVEKEPLAEWFPELQAAVPIDEAGVHRLKRSLALGKVPIERFSVLMLGGATEPIPGEAMKELTQQLAAKSNGFRVAIDVLSMRLYGDGSKKRAHHDAVLQAGRALLTMTVPGEKDDRRDYELGSIAKACLVGEEGEKVAEELCRSLRIAVAADQTQGHYHNDLMQGVVAAQPLAALDGLFGGDDQGRAQGLGVVRDMEHLEQYPIDAIPEDIIIEWCKQEPAVRYPLIAKTIRPFLRPKDQSNLSWTGIAMKLLDGAPDRVAVMRELSRKLMPMSWSGSRATVMEANTQLLNELEGHTDAALATFVKAEKDRLAAYIEKEKLWEAASDRATGERFE
jgi:hypothetical protein